MDIVKAERERKLKAIYNLCVDSFWNRDGKSWDFPKLAEDILEAIEQVENELDDARFAKREASHERTPFD